ncbi:hypothetical protein [Escherichia coli]|uniref:hypothetical protein n=1 Tax=Escherichia coli TaxID=562 RepID=UPI00388FA994
MILLNFITTSLKAPEFATFSLLTGKNGPLATGKDERDDVHKLLNCGGVMLTAFPENSCCILKNRRFYVVSRRKFKVRT